LRPVVSIAQFNTRPLGRAGGNLVRAVIDGGAADVIAGARADGRDTLLDPEGFALVRALGVAVPAHAYLRTPQDLQDADLAAIPSDRLAVKVVSPQVMHKADVGAVVFVPNQRAAVERAIEAIAARVAPAPVKGYTVSEHVPHSDAPGAQLLLGLRWTDDFGPVVTLGPGGVLTEFLSRELSGGRGIVVLAPGLTRPELIPQLLEGKTITRLVTGEVRGAPRRMPLADLAGLLQRLLDFAASPAARSLCEFEINPLVMTDRGPTALDVLATLRDPAAGEQPDRPIHKLRSLLEPERIALIGVSDAINPGRIILQNLLREGFPQDRIAVVKPGTDRIEGVRCVPDIASLPQPADVLVLSVAAAHTPETLEQIVRHRAAESVIVIPGGLGERAGSEELERRMRDTLHAARRTEWQGPIVNGGNCLGVRSVPGGYDTMFIPEHKLRWPAGPAGPVAIVSQSGALAVAKSSKLAHLNPRYVISVGNQTDLTVGDYLTYLKHDADVEVFACYVEGFRALDGRRWLEAAAEITAAGRAVVLYRGGRTPAGARASASHTAAIAGDYVVTRELAESAGVLVADSLADFEDLIRLCAMLRAKQVCGWRLGAVSNAGFECVAIADRLGRFRLGSFSDETSGRLADLLESRRLETVVSVANPVDLTPIMDDAPYEAAVQAVLDDAGVDVAVVGCVPLTGALRTLPSGEGHDEDVRDPRSIASRLGARFRESDKAWVAVVDGGAHYDVMATQLENDGVPTFRTADRALRLFEAYCGSRLRPTEAR
jgi:acyl-CoA synthetase (NDP forming)